MTWDDRPSRSELAAEAAEEWVEAHPDGCPACLGSGCCVVEYDPIAGPWYDGCEECEGSGKRQPVLALTAPELLREHLHGEYR